MKDFNTLETALENEKRSSSFSEPLRSCSTTYCTGVPWRIASDRVLVNAASVAFSKTLLISRIMVSSSGPFSKS